jgi:hypothetical protein
MSGFFKKLLGFILLVSTMGLATCQSLVKAAPETDRAQQTGDRQ